MIVYTMTEEQIAAEARRDFAEMSGRLRVAYDRFRVDARRYITYAYNNKALNISRKQTFTLRTKNGNTWNVYFQTRPDRNGMVGLVYLAIPFDNGHEYLVIKNFDTYLVERYTRHFIQRYEERHILPHQINTQHLPLPLHFVLTHCGKNFYRAEKYYSKELNIRENDTRSWFIMGDGMVVVEDKATEMKMWTFVTYIDCSELYDYQQKLLEEERAWNMFESLDEVIGNDDDNDLFTDKSKRKHAIYSQLAADPNTPDLIERYIRRTTKAKPRVVEDVVQTFRKSWAEIVEITRKFDAEAERLGHFENHARGLTKSILDSNK